MIAYFFPPEGNAGTYRPLRFARALSKMGWSPTVISADPYCYERYDTELLTLIPLPTEVIRVRGRDGWHAFQAWRGRRVHSGVSENSDKKTEINHVAPRSGIRARAREFVRKVEASYYLPDLARPWIRPAVSESIRVCKSKQVKVIWATVGPLSAGVVAHRVSQTTGVPYVLDFRDPWGLNYYANESRRSKTAARMVCRTMYQIFRGAQSVVFLFDTVAECYQRAYPGALEDKQIHIIPNGYEGSLDEFFVPLGEKCLILYTGTIATYRYDTLLQALVLLRESHPVQANHLCLQFVGEGTRDLQQKVDALDLSQMIICRPPTSYGEIRRLQQEAHAFLILGRTSERKGHELVAGAKLFEYLKARKPIVGVLPGDETKKVLEYVGVSTLADVDSLPEIIAVFLQILEAWGKGTLKTLLPDHAACEQYSAETQTNVLIRALKGDLAERPFQSGVVKVPMSLAKDIGILK